jgi:hypothetical protein
MDPISSLQIYSKEIDDILSNRDYFSQNRIFNRYTSLPNEKQKETFVLVSFIFNGLQYIWESTFYDLGTSVSAAVSICFVYFLPDIGYKSEYNLYSSSGVNAETH